MTDEELKAIEATIEEDGWAGQGMKQNNFRHETVTLVAEVRRLRGLIKEVETAARMGAACPWCDSWIAERHNADCPAFTESGDVR